MKLYYTKGACSLVVRIVVNELGLPCEYESVDLRSKKTETGANFLEINPKGSVPTLRLNSTETLTENAVILQYLADEAKATELLPEVGNFDRYRVLEWLNYITTELHKGFGPLFNPTITAEVKEQWFIPLLKSKLSFVNSQLSDQPYLLGKEFTLPDAYLFVMLLWTFHFKLDLAQWSHLQRYFEALKNKKSIQKSLQQEGLG